MVCNNCKKRYPETEKKKSSVSGFDIFFCFATFGTWIFVIMFKVMLNSILGSSGSDQPYMPCKYCGKRYF